MIKVRTLYFRIFRPGTFSQIVTIPVHAFIECKVNLHFVCL
jgi:hypothetical protein